MTTKTKKTWCIIGVIIALLAFVILGGTLLYSLTTQFTFWACLIISFFAFIALDAMFTGVHTWIRSIGNYIKGIY